MLTIQTGLNRDARRDRLFREIRRACDAGEEHLYLLTPDETTFVNERDAIVRLGDRVSRHIEVVSFRMLMEKFYNAAGHRSACMDDSGRILAMISALYRVRKHLKHYTASSSRPDFAEDVLRARDMLLRSGADLDVLCVSTELSPALAGKLYDLKLISDAYLEICGGSTLDPCEEEQEFIKKIRQYGDGFLADCIIYCDGFSELDDLRIGILCALEQKCRSMLISLPCAGVDDPRESSAGTVRTLRKILAHYDDKSSIELLRTKDESDDHAALSLIQKDLCSTAIAVPQSIPNAERHIRLFEDTTPYAEAQHIAGTILLAIRKGTRFRDISIVLPDYDRYAPVFNSVFRRYNIPCYFASRKNAILGNPVMVSITSALEAVSRGFPTVETIQYLKSGITNLTVDEADLLENYALAYRFRGKGWEPVGGWVMHPRGVGMEFKKEDEDLLAKINGAREKGIRPLLELRDALRDATTIADQVKALHSFLCTTGFPNAIQDIADHLLETGDRQGAMEFNQVNDIVCDALEQMYEAIGHVIAKPEEFTRLFRILCTTRTICTIPTTLDQVQILNLPDSRHICSKIRYFAGCSDGVFPSYQNRQGTVLTDEDAEELAGLGINLPCGIEATVNRQLADINSSISGAKQMLILSYSFSNDITPSPLYLRAQQLLPVLKVQTGAGEDGIYQADLLHPEAAGRLIGRLSVRDAYQNILYQLADIDNDQLQDTASRIIMRAGWELGSLESKTVEDLNGGVISLSATKTDDYSNCRYFGFLRHDLGIHEPPTGNITSPIFGSFLHAVMDKAMKEIESRGGVRMVSDKEIGEIARRHIADYTATKLRGLKGQSDRYLHMYMRDTHEILSVLTNCCAEFRKSSFHATGFEVTIGKEGNMPAIPIVGAKMTTTYTGKIDRIDSCVIDGVPYFRVADYKSGSTKRFDYADVLAGQAMQLIIYQRAIHAAHPELTESGFMYVPAKDSFVALSCRPEDDETITSAKKTEHERHGLLLDDIAVLDAMEELGTGKPEFLPIRVLRDGTVTGEVCTREQLHALDDFTEIMMIREANRIADGDIMPNPISHGPGRSACTYCPYKHACMKDLMGTSYRYRAKTSKDQFFAVVNKIVKEHVRASVESYG